MRPAFQFFCAFLFLVSSVFAQSNHRFTVAFRSQPLPANALAIVGAAGATVIQAFPELGVMEVSGPASVLNQLNASADVVAAAPTLTVGLPRLPVQAGPQTRGRVVPGDLWPLQWDIQQVTNTGASWSMAAGSLRTVVAIIDTGISTRHPDLAMNVLGGQNFVPDGPRGMLDPNDIEDRNGHGSHVAGAVAARGRVTGVGPYLGLRAYRVFGATGGAPSTRIVSAMLAAIRDGVDVISMSLAGYEVIAYGTWTDPETGQAYPFKDVPDWIAQKRAAQLAVQRGIVVVAAAGNEGLNISHPPSIVAYLNSIGAEYGYTFRGAAMESPAGLPGVVAVSATGPKSVFASYSNYGDGQIDVAAPGGDFQRYPAAGWWTDMCLSTYMGGGYAWLAGTSMATPKVSAISALLIDRAKAAGEKLTPSQVVARIRQSALDAGRVSYDPRFGYGVANAFTALAQ